VDEPALVAPDVYAVGDVACLPPVPVATAPGH
jgi:hypothetical protein